MRYENNKTEKWWREDGWGGSYFDPNGENRLIPNQKPKRMKNPILRFSQLVFEFATTTWAETTKYIIRHSKSHSNDRL